MPAYLPPRLGISISEVAAEAYASATAGEVRLIAFELHHPGFTAPGRVVADWVNHTLTHEADAAVDPSTACEYVGVPLRYFPPDQSAEGATPSLGRIEIDNVSLTIGRLMRLAKESREPVTLIVREYLASDTSAPHVTPPLVMNLTGIVITAETSSGQLSFGDLTNRRFPPRLYTPADFPTLAA
jgi:hypothetical protein